MRLNKNGFAVTSIIYSMLVLFLALVLLIMSNLASRKNLFDKTKYEVLDKLESEVVDKVETHNLPEAYQEVEYIETTGTQYIDTGVLAKNNTRIETKIEVTTTNQDISVFGYYKDSVTFNSNGNYYHLTPYLSKWYIGQNGSEVNASTYNSQVGTQYSIVFNDANGSVIINNETIHTNGTYEAPEESTIAISKRGSQSKYRYGKFKYFNFKIFDKAQGAYVRNMIPCYRKSDDVIGLYDLVNDVFYENAGTGTFLKGNDVKDKIESDVTDKVETHNLPDEYQEVEYIGAVQSKTEGYLNGINTGVNWTELSKVSLNMYLSRYYVSSYYSPMLFSTYSNDTTRSAPFIYINNSGIQTSGVTASSSPSYTLSDLYTNQPKEFDLSISATNSGTVAFGSWSDEYWSADWVLYEMKMYNKENTLIRHFIPCYRKSDNVIGMYDLIGGVFYTNTGTGTFTKGPDLT